MLLEPTSAHMQTPHTRRGKPVWGRGVPAPAQLKLRGDMSGFGPLFFLPGMTGRGFRASAFFRFPFGAGCLRSGAGKRAALTVPTAAARTFVPVLERVRIAANRDVQILAQIGHHTAKYFTNCAHSHRDFSSFAGVVERQCSTDKGQKNGFPRQHFKGAF